MNSQHYFENYKSFKKMGVLNEFRVDSLIDTSKKNEPYLTTAKIATAYSIYLYKTKKYSKALKYAYIELECLEKGKASSEKYVHVFFRLGAFYYMNKEIDKAIKYYKKVIQLNSVKLRTARAYCHLGKCYRRKNEYYKAVSYFKKGILLLKKLKKYKLVISHSINLAIVYENINTKKSLQESLNYLQSANLLLKIHKGSKRNFYTLNSGFGNHYNNTETYNFNKSNYYFHKNLKLSLKENDSIIITSSYENLGDLYKREKRDSAFFFFKKAIQYTSKNKEILAICNFDISDFFYKKKEYKRALVYANKAINTIIKTNKKQLTKQLLYNTSNKKIVLMALKKKVEILIKQYLKNIDNTFLKKAIINCKTADELVNIIQETNTEQYTKLYWQNKASQVYLLGVHVAFLLNDATLFFYFIEKNKAILLAQNITKNVQQINLPKNSIIRKIVLKTNILSLENKLLKEKNKSIKTVLQDSLFTIKEIYEKYIDSLKIMYPSYFNTQVNIKQLSLQEVQEKLDTTTIVFSYLWNSIKEEQEEALFGMIISKKETYPFKITNLHHFKQLIQRYQQLISKPLSTQKEQQEFRQVSFLLYQKLFPKEISKNKKLIIIPDGKLQNLSFDALITKENSSEHLLQRNSISYAYSMSFLQFNNQLKRITNSDFIGYAPVTFDSIQLPSLKGSKNEIQAISKILNGKIYFNKNASKTHFLTHSNQSKIIHLATHADASNTPWVAFYDKKLALHELYTYKNNAELVVLSGCNTNLGEIANGEGVLSLARGFFFSGAKTVVSSLWGINDKATSFIMSNFYKNLQKGNDKATALQQAKLAYIDNHSLSDASPYYWASFVLIGDASTIKLSNQHYYLYVFVIFLVVLFIIYLFKKK